MKEVIYIMSHVKQGQSTIYHLDRDSMVCSREDVIICSIEESERLINAMLDAKSVFEDMPNHIIKLEDKGDDVELDAYSNPALNESEDDLHNMIMDYLGSEKLSDDIRNVTNIFLRKQGVYDYRV